MAIVETPTDSPFFLAWSRWATEHWAIEQGQGGYSRANRTWSSDQWMITLRQEDTNDVHIEYIQVSPNARREKLGGEILSALIAIADTTGVTLSLEADETNDAIGDPPEEGDYDNRDHWLQDWYSRLGFEYDNRVGDSGPYMIREPGLR